jgi:hypothetical protein
MRLTRYYCSRCQLDNQEHEYKNCLKWRFCGFCDQEGHWGFDCPTPHFKCLRNRCGVHVGHPYIGKMCPRSRETKVMNFSYACEGQVCDLERAKTIYGEGLDWSSYGMPE